MNINGDISKIQKSIYRYSYAFVDLDNFKLATNKEQLLDKQFNSIKSDREKCLNYIKDYFKCDYKDIIKNGVDDPCFYLKKNLEDKVSFAKLIEKYFPTNKTIGQLYEFFSIMIHPRCEAYPKAEESTMVVHKYFVNDVINLVTNFLSENNLLPATINDYDFNNDFFYNPLLANNVNNIKQIEIAFNLSIKKICNLPNGYDWFSWFFLEKSKYLLLDMMISLSLGYTEHVIASFKPFIELFSVFHNINTCEDLSEFNYLKRSFWISSRAQFNEHIKKYNTSSHNEDIKKEIQSLYENFYKSKYNVNSFEDFYKEYIRNSLYFLNDSRKSFNKFVREAIESITTSESQSKDFMILYKISKDMAHASGYSFNATIDLIRMTSHKIVYTTLYAIYHFMLNASITLAEHSIDIDLANIIELFKNNMQVQIDAIEEIYQHNKTENN